MLESQSLRQSQPSQRMKSKIHVSSWQRVHLQCNVHFYKYSMSKGHWAVKNQGSNFQQESGQNPSQISTSGPKSEAQQLGLRSGPSLPANRTKLVAWGQGTGLPLSGPHSGLLPGLFTSSDQRQEEQARIGTRRLSAFSEFQVCLRCQGARALCAFIHPQGHVWRGRPNLEALSFCRVFKIDSGFIYFLFSFIAINWLLIGWNVQLSISSNTIK